MFEVLKVDYVNTYGIVLHWAFDPDLRPVMLNAHQDVMPVQSDTLAKTGATRLLKAFDGLSALWT